MVRRNSIARSGGEVQYEILQGDQSATGSGRSPVEPPRERIARGSADDQAREIAIGGRARGSPADRPTIRSGRSPSVAARDDRPGTDRWSGAGDRHRRPHGMIARGLIDGQEREIAIGGRAG
jgi:hypothetical protein